MTGAPSPSPVGMDVLEAIAGRRSIRRFLSDPVPRETVRAILKVAGRAPSGSNIQPWHVHVLDGAARDALCAEIHAAHEAADPPEAEYQYYPSPWREPYLSRRRATGWGLYGLLGIEKGDKAAMKAQHGRNYLFFDAPVGLIFTIERDMPLGSWMDTAMFIQSVMIAARGFGLETCAQQAFARYHEILGRRLPIPPERMVVCGMALGRPDPDAPENALVTDRMAVEEMATFVDRLAD